MTSLENLRHEFLRQPIDLADLDPDPVRQFGVWFDQATRLSPGGWMEINAATLATADRSGRPSARMVLVKGYDAIGFRFYTNYRSRKARQLAENPQASLLFYWPHVVKQVRIEGPVRRLSREESEAYFHERPRESQLSAVASPQSEVIEGRGELEARVAELRERFADQPIPLPEYWGGYVLQPEEIEFWHGRENRLHDRFRYRRRADGAWLRQRLGP